MQSGRGPQPGRIGVADQLDAALQQEAFQAVVRRLDEAHLQAQALADPLAEQQGEAADQLLAFHVDIGHAVQRAEAPA